MTTHFDVQRTVDADAADHVVEARHRARQVLSGESHLGAVDDWRRALGSARDALILVWLTWVALHGFGDPPFTGYMLIAFAIGLALITGISTARATQTQVQYYAAELERERTEIREHFEDEQEEVRALYAAKGFREPLLTQVVNVLCADDDRLLKVMMEEELGLALHHVNHPILVGAWNFVASALAGLALAVPVALGDPLFAHWWMPMAGSAALVLLSIVSWKATGRSFLEFFVVGAFMALVTGGVVYFLAQWLSQRLVIPS